MKHVPEHLPVAGTAAEKFLIRQQDDISCGPACLASAAKIFNVAAAYKDFRAVLKPDPEIGSVNEELAALCARILPCLSAGENSYTCGLAVANIMFEGEGHYVLFLEKQGEEVLYYEPFHHELVIDRLDHLEWVSESGHLKKWSVNLATLPENFPAKDIDAWRRLAQTPDRTATQPLPRHKQKPQIPKQ